MRKRLSPDFKLRQKIKNVLINTLVLKTIQRTKQVFKPIYHRKMSKSFYKFPRFGKIHAFCSITGRGRSIIQKYKISRNMFKLNLNLGLLYSMRKASW